jgi:CDP-diacylglycerol--glycerol-3-phosphate 3-phosphatidyltransferase
MGEIERRSKRLAETLIGPLARAGVTANHMTIAGFFAAIPVAALIATDYLVVGGILLLIASAFDTLDGAVARVRDEVTEFGAFLDSTLDRYVEVAYFGALIWLFLGRDDAAGVILSFVVLSGSIMVSYTRARAEGLGLYGKVGVLQRPERLILLGIALIFSGWMLLPVLWAMAVVTNFTVLQRILHVRSQTRKRQ